MLEEKGLISDYRLFVVQELLSAQHDKIKPGIYDLSTDCLLYTSYPEGY